MDEVSELVVSNGTGDDAPMPPPPAFVPSGLWVPIVTPFHDDGSLDLDSLGRLARRLLGDGAAGLVAMGTTGEPSTLTEDERVAAVETVAAACRRADRPLMVGAGTNSTQGTIEEIRRVTDRVDVAAALVVVPYYTRPSQQAVVEHFGLVADASPVPIVMYNIPYRTGRGLDATALLDAGAHPNVVGLKQSVGALDGDTLELLAHPDPGFVVLAGDDAFIAPTVLMGGGGAIAAAAHLCTPTMDAMTAAASSGDAGRARELARTLLPVVSAGCAEPSPALWKAALAASGAIASPAVRRPLTHASREATERLLAATETCVAETPIAAARPFP